MIDFNARTGIITATSFTGLVTGNADTATALDTGRTIGMTGDVVWTSASFDGTGNVTGTSTIQAQSVDVAMLADGVDGELITWSAAGVAATVGVGTVNQVLTSGGAGVAPTFEDAAGGGGTVTSSGTPLNNEVAVFATGTDINSDSTFTWDGSVLTVTTVIAPLQGASNTTWEVANGGIVTLTGFADGDTSTRRIDFDQLDGTRMAFIGHSSSSNFLIENEVTSGEIRLQAADSVDAPHLLFLGDPDGAVTLYFDGIAKFNTVDESAADATSGATVVDGQGATRNVGFNESVEVALSSTGTITPFTQGDAGRTIYWTGGTATNMDTYTNVESNQTNIPVGAMWFVQNNGAGTLTFRGGTSVTIRYWDGGGAAPADVDVTIARGSIATVRKEADAVYDIWGIGLS